MGRCWRPWRRRQSWRRRPTSPCPCRPPPWPRRPSTAPRPPPRGGRPPPPPPPPAPPPAGAPPPAAGPPPPGEAGPPRPITRRLWFWLAVSGIIVAASVAVIAVQNPTTTRPDCPSGYVCP